VRDNINTTKERKKERKKDLILKSLLLNYPKYHHQKRKTTFTTIKEVETPTRKSHSTVIKSYNQAGVFSKM